MLCVAWGGWVISEGDHELSYDKLTVLVDGSI